MQKCKWDFPIHVPYQFSRLLACFSFFSSFFDLGISCRLCLTGGKRAKTKEEIPFLEVLTSNVVPHH
jgi:hypothetical protein